MEPIIFAEEEKRIADEYVINKFTEKYTTPPKNNCLCCMVESLGEGGKEDANGYLEFLRDISRDVYDEITDERILDLIQDKIFNPLFKMHQVFKKIKGGGAFICNFPRWNLFKCGFCGEFLGENVVFEEIYGFCNEKCKNSMKSMMDIPGNDVVDKLKGNFEKLIGGGDFLEYPKTIRDVYVIVRLSMKIIKDSVTLGDEPDEIIPYINSIVKEAKKYAELLGWYCSLSSDRATDVIVKRFKRGIRGIETEVWQYEGGTNRFFCIVSLYPIYISTFFIKNKNIEGKLKEKEDIDFGVFISNAHELHEHKNRKLFEIINIPILGISSKIEDE